MSDTPEPQPEPPTQKLGVTRAEGLFGLAKGADEPDPLPTPEELQRDFPQYEILALLGRGGMGVVYKAKHKGLARLVAIKLLPPELGEDADFAARFQREARAMARLEHPNIIAVYDFGQSADGRLYFVMEFVDGANLAELIRSGGLEGSALSLPRTGTDGAVPSSNRLDPLTIAAQLCDALAYAHGEGIVHRDIKPANVMLDRKGRVKVADFGLARLIDAEIDASALTTTGTVMGTLDYMAPEQRKGMAVDHRADIYSLGVMLYEMLCREVPHGMFDPPSTLVPGVDERFDQIVLKAMQSAPERRYQDAGEMKTDIAATRVPLVEPLSPAPTAAAKESRPWLYVALAVGLGAAIFAGVIVRGKARPVSPKVGPTAADVTRVKERWVRMLERPEDHTVDFPTELRDGWVAKRRDAPTQTVHFPDVMRDGAVRAEFRGVPETDSSERLRLRTAQNSGNGPRYWVGRSLSSVSLFYSHGAERVLLKRVAAPPVTEAETYLLEFRAVGRRLTVKQNGQELFTIEDGRIAQGRAGICVPDGTSARNVELLDLDSAVAAKTTPTSVSPPPPPPAATKDAPFVNTLGMKFVPVPITGGPTGGQRVLFSVWETRVQDYEVFAKETKREWPKPPFEQALSHPAVLVDWDDAQAFCAWLTGRERKRGTLGAAEVYRLPSDHEWSCAARIGDREDFAAPPSVKDKALRAYLWGVSWPPPAGAGNLGGEETTDQAKATQFQSVLKGYRDAFPFTAPVGSFEADAFGLFDLLGNVFEWCDGWLSAEQQERFIRGGSFATSGGVDAFASRRIRTMGGGSGKRIPDVGFRIVLAGESVAIPAAK